MEKTFFEELSKLSEESSIDKNLLIEKIKTAMQKAAKKDFPNGEERIIVDIDPDRNIFEMYLIQDVVEEEPWDETEIHIDAARLIDPNAVVGGTIRKRLDISRFGRNAAQTAKQSIKSDLRDINRDRILSEFANKEGECIICKVVQVENGGTVTLTYNNTELYLFKNEQIPKEDLAIGQMVKVYVTTIANKSKKPIIKISRARKELVKRLLENEIPEIYDGTVEIVAISREAGFRTKVAVRSNNPEVDAVGACIGMNKGRITPIMEELNGEKIDIIPYFEEPEKFIAKALATATVLRVEITSEEDRTCTVIVPNNKLSLAIGNRGLNAKLAAKLTGYKIDIKPEVELPVPEISDEAEESAPVAAEETVEEPASEE